MKESLEFDGVYEKEDEVDEFGLYWTWERFIDKTGKIVLKHHVSSDLFPKEDKYFETATNAKKYFMKLKAKSKKYVKRNG
jgi:hypothetical protein